MKRAAVGGLAALFLVAAAGARAQTGGLTRLGKVILSDAANERSLYDLVYDPAGFVYTSGSHGNKIAKVDVRGNVPMEVGSAVLAGGEAGLTCGAIDPAAGYAYFGSSAAPGKVVKIALGGGASPPTYIGSTTLLAGESGILGLLIDTTDPDPAKHYLYAATWSSPATIVKFAPGAGNARPVRLGALALLAGETRPRRGVIDAANGFAYFASIDAASYFVKIALGAGPALPTRIGAAALAADEGHIGSAVIDAANGYAYLGTYDPATVPSKVVKVALGAGAAPPSRVGALTLGPDEFMLSSGVADPVNGYAFFGSDLTHPAKVFKIRMGAGNALPTEAGVLQLQPGTCGTACYPPDLQTIPGPDPVLYGELYLQSAGIDVARGIAWFGTDSTAGQVIAVGLYAAPASTGFFPVAPCRLVDTRGNIGTSGGPLPGAGGERGFALTGACGVPSLARALVVNVAVTGIAADGDLRAYPSDGVLPTATVISFRAGQTRANNAILLLSSDGTGSVTIHNDASGPLDLIVDVSGYFE
jgi:hypothetical protein